MPLEMSAVARLSNRISSVSNSAGVKTRVSVSSLMIASRASSNTRGLFSLVDARAMVFILGSTGKMSNTAAVR
jgi:hypothetical protein